MVKSYYRYGKTPQTCGLITNEQGNILYDAYNVNQVYTCTLDSITCWNIKQSTVIFKLNVDTNHSTANTNTIITTRIIHHPTDSNIITAGYDDGTIRIWSINTRTCINILRGHAGTITALCYSTDGSILCSGSTDTNIIIWDAITQSGMVKLIGHKQPITSICVLQNDQHNSIMFTGSRDGTIKLWDLVTYHNIQTLTETNGTEVWALKLNSGGNRLIAAGSDKQVRVYKLYSRSAQSNQHIASQQVCVYIHFLHCTFS